MYISSITYSITDGDIVKLFESPIFSYISGKRYFSAMVNLSSKDKWSNLTLCIRSSNTLS